MALATARAGVLVLGVEGDGQWSDQRLNVISGGGFGCKSVQCAAVTC